MKKMFNIKRISLMILMVLCMFFATKNVEAAEKYVCYYVEPLLDTKMYDFYDPETNFAINRETSQIYVQLTYENGKASFKFYDFESKTTHNRIVNEDYTVDISISSQSGEQLTDADFSNGCPKNLERMAWFDTYDGHVYDLFKSGTEEYKQYRETKLENSLWAKTLNQLQNNDDYCYSDVVDYSSIAPNVIPRSICDKAISIELPETQDAEVESGNVLSCSYVNETNLIQDGSQNYNIDPHLTMKVNFDTKTISFFNSWATNSNDITANFTVDKLNGKCPNEVYTNTTNYKTVYLKASELPSGETATKYSHLKYLTKDDIETGKTGCEALGGLVKYLEMAYTLLRYLVPTIIIIFSVIDFLGVVLSGENDRMEKAKKRFAIRLIVGFIILIVPFILELLLKLVGIIEAKQSLVDAACNIF